MFIVYCLVFLPNLWLQQELCFFQPDQLNKCWATLTREKLTKWLDFSFCFQHSSCNFNVIWAFEYWIHSIYHKILCWFYYLWKDYYFNSMHACTSMWCFPQMITVMHRGRKALRHWILSYPTGALGAELISHTLLTGPLSRHWFPREVCLEDFLLVWWPLMRSTQFDPWCVLCVFFCCWSSFLVFNY